MDHYEPEIARLAERNAQLETAHADVVAERDELEPVIERLRADALADRQEIVRIAQENSRLEVENAELRSERKALSARTEELERRVTQERASVERSLVEQGAMATRISDVLEPQVEQLSSRISALQRENGRLVKSSNRLQDDNSEMRSERKAHLALKAELEVATAALDKLEKEKAEYYEPELARLKSNVEHSKFEKETQMLRRRVMAYADQSRRIGGAVASLEAKLAELEHLRDSWYLPELERLSAIVEQHETTKREWFEPQLDSRAAHIATLEEQIHSRDALIKSLESKNAVRAGKSRTAATKSSGRIFRFKR